MFDTSEKVLILPTLIICIVIGIYLARSEGGSTVYKIASGIGTTLFLFVAFILGYLAIRSL